MVTYPFDEIDNLLSQGEQQQNQHQANQLGAQQNNYNDLIHSQFIVQQQSALTNSYPAWYHKKGAREELISMIKGLSKVEKALHGIETEEE